jgi:hypothetical protein
MAGARLTLEFYERQLDRIGAFYPRLDAKVSALFAIASAQLAVAALNLSANDLKLWWITVPLAFFLFAICWTLINLYRCAYPHLEGGNRSLIYFKEIAALRESEYIEQLEAADQAALKEDVAGQIWRNSEIVCCKYRYLKSATIAAMLSLLPWSILLASTSLTHLRIPVVKG